MYRVADDLSVLATGPDGAAVEHALDEAAEDGLAVVALGPGLPVDALALADVAHLVPRLDRPLKVTLVDEACPAPGFAAGGVPLRDRLVRPEDVEERQVVAVAVAEAGPGGARLIALVERVEEDGRVVDEGEDVEHVGGARPSDRGEQDARLRGLERKLEHLVPELRHRQRVVDRAEAVEGQQTLGDCVKSASTDIDRQPSRLRGDEEGDVLKSGSGLSRKSNFWTSATPISLSWRTVCVKSVRWISGKGEAAMPSYVFCV
jgi:hypothetical protein